MPGDSAVQSEHRQPDARPADEPAPTEMGEVDPAMASPNTVDTSEPAGPPPHPEPLKPQRSLKSLTIRGSLWTAMAHGFGQVMRMGGHVLLAWLLVPEVFGLTLIIDGVISGLKMFSDVGIGPSIIQNKRGDDRRFLDTAWTIQVIRGGAMFVGACALAWPMALVYDIADQPSLMALIPVAALGALVAGFYSTAPSMLHRHMRLATLNLYRVGGEMVRLGAMVALAWWFRSIWALVIGGLIGSLFELALSYCLIRGHRNRLHWDRECSRELFRFGRWVFVGTALSFVVGHGDKFLLGALLANLGLYAVALRWAKAAPLLLRSISSTVLFPVYSRIASESPETLRRKMFRARRILMLIALPPLCMLAVAGDYLVVLLYRDDYLGAGWMIQVLAAGSIFSCLNMTVSPALLASGDSFRHMLVLVNSSCMLLLATAVGATVGGESGLVVAVASVSALNYPVLSLAVRKYGVWMPRFDAACILACAAFIATGLALRHAI